MQAGLRTLRRVCHDLRQELAVIHALVELAATESGLPEQSRRRLDQISAQASHISQMLQNVVERTASHVELDLTKFMASVVADVQVQTDVVCHLQAEPGGLVADPVMLRRALLNMLDNAVRAAGPEGSVNVRGSMDGEDVLIEVEDSGPGFGHIGPGLASLGLDVVRECANLHGGQVDAASGASGGAFVRLRLPRTPSRGWGVNGRSRVTPLLTDDDHAPSLATYSPRDVSPT